MNEPLHIVLVVGATGSIGRLVVAEALRRGFAVRALVRDLAKSWSRLPPEVDRVVGDLTLPETLLAAVEGVDAVSCSRTARVMPRRSVPRLSTMAAYATCWRPSGAEGRGSP